MNECPYERDIIRQPDPAMWPEAVRRHVADCESCAAAAAVSPRMLALARQSPREHRLPEPALVWLKAQLLRNTLAAERATRPITALQIAAYLIVGGGWAGLVMGKWDALRAWFLTVNPGGWLSGAVAAPANTAALSLGFFITVFMLSSVTIILALHTVLAEE